MFHSALRPSRFSSRPFWPGLGAAVVLGVLCILFGARVGAQRAGGPPAAPPRDPGLVRTPAGAVPPQDEAPLMGIVAVRPDEGFAGPITSAATNMTYHGGPVQHNQLVRTIFWQGPSGSFPANYIATNNQFIQDLSGSAIYGITTQYTDGSGHISPTLTFGGTWTDTVNTITTGDTDAPTIPELQAEVTRAKAANSWTDDGNTYYQIFLPSGFGTSRGYCGFHAFANPAVGIILLPAAHTSGSCLIPTGPFPNGATSVLDAAIDVSSHEVMETVTDPLGNAWFYVNASGEIGDLCNFNFGTRAGDGLNVTFNGHKYLIQMEWSNAVSGCSLNLPGIVAGTGTLVSESVPNSRLDPGEVVGVSLCLTNFNPTASGSVTGTLQATGGVTSPSGAQVYGAIAAFTTACKTFTFTVGSACGGLVVATLHQVEAGGPTLDPTYTFQVGSISGSSFFSENFDGVSAPALPAGWTVSALTGSNPWTTVAATPDTAPNKAFAADPATITDSALVSPTIAIPSSGAQVSFRHSYNLDFDSNGFYDGGVLEISIAGGAFADIVTAGGAFTAGSYNGTISSSFGSTISGRSAWSGNSGGYITSSAVLPASASGQNVKLRWRLATDNTVAFTGWSVDTITVTTFSCSSVSIVTTLSRNPAILNFAATKNGAGSATLVNQTPAQGVTVGYTGTVPSWTAVADQTWVQITNGSQTGQKTFTVAIVNPGNVIAGSTSLTSTITISASGANPVTVTVNLAVQQTLGSSASAFGQIDTPAQSASNLQGAIVLTGWSLDDIGVSAVQVFRQCFGFDNPASCQIVLGNNVVYIGDANFVAGARPDVEAAFPGVPLNYRAGWGLLVLSNFLPHVPNSQVNGGQGGISFYAFANDQEAHRTLLGRSSADHTPTSVTLDNDHIALPFGNLDTPVQSGTVNGFTAVSGWALTPDSNTIADGTDILIGLSGSTIQLFVDGGLVGTLAYNQCRGNVGNPPPPGVYCNDDVSNAFGNLTPQPTFTTRTSNPTKFRNLDAARGPIASVVLDTNPMTNGQHTIGLTATDSAARAGGIGSRFFIVSNAGGGAPPSDEQIAAMLDAPAKSRGPASSLDQLQVSGRPLSVRTGFDMRTVSKEAARTASGIRTATIPVTGRLELSLATSVTAGYLVTNGELRDLPVGSHLDTATGVFTWSPPAGYLGTYRLAFIVGGQKLLVDVTVQ